MISLAKELILAYSLRAILIVYGEWHDSMFRLKYTDIDYVVFSDAARHLYQGGSPFDRDTYRYTPLIAMMLLPNEFICQTFGKWLFITFDIVCALLLCYIQKLERGDWNATKFRWALRCSWLFNPITVAVSSRGNAESFVLAVVLLSHALTLRSCSGLPAKATWRAFLAGVVFGFSVHVKVYPIIYAAAYWLALSDYVAKTATKSALLKLVNAVFIPNKRQFFFAIGSALSLLSLTITFYKMFGYKFLYEAYLYHFDRLDSQHNFSVYFYPLRLLSDAAMYGTLRLVSLLSFVLQWGTVLWLTVAHFEHVSFCLFALTFAFVALNKVCTSQYFLWYVALVPLACANVRLGARSWVRLTALWLVAQANWLLFAYLFEFERWNTLPFVAFGSLLFCASNLYTLRYLLLNLDKPHRD